MAGPDTGTPQAPQLAAGGERREHAVTHRPPDTRHEHHTALSQGQASFVLGEDKTVVSPQNFILISC